MLFAVAVEDLIRSGGYAALAALTLLENLFPPIPSEVVLPVAGFYVGRGELGFVLAVLAATAGSLIGALMLYGAGRTGSRRFSSTRAQAWFDRHGDKAVLFGRVVPGVRSLVSVPAGAAQMPLPRFVVLTTIGSGVWNATLIGAGWALGHNWDAVGGIVGPAGKVALGALVVALAVWAVKPLRDRRRRPVRE